MGELVWGEDSALWSRTEKNADKIAIKLFTVTVSKVSELANE